MLTFCPLSNISLFAFLLLLCCFFFSFFIGGGGGGVRGFVCVCVFSCVFSLFLFVYNLLIFRLGGVCLFVCCFCWWFLFFFYFWGVLRVVVVFLFVCFFLFFFWGGCLFVCFVFFWVFFNVCFLIYSMDGGAQSCVCHYVQVCSCVMKSIPIQGKLLDDEKTRQVTITLTYFPWLGS